MNRDARQVLTELLVLRAQAGDSCAFAELHDLWSPDLRRLAASQVREHRDLDEIVQDTWISIARALSKLQDPACFPRWAFRILDCRCADRLRRRYSEKGRLRSLDGAEDIATDQHAIPANPCGLASMQEAIARLDTHSRKLLHLFYDADLSVAEVAEILRVPVGTVKSRLYSLRETLRKQLQNHE